MQSNVSQEPRRRQILTNIRCVFGRQSLIIIKNIHCVKK